MCLLDSDKKTSLESLNSTSSFTITFILLFCFLPSHWLTPRSKDDWFFYFLSRLLSHTEETHSTHLRFGWLHCLCLHLVTFHFAFFSGHLNFITNLGMYLGHLPLTHQNCWLHQPVCECNALVQFCRTESCLLPNYWSLKSRVSLARNSSQLHRQRQWCVALADWPTRAASSEKW